MKLLLDTHVLLWWLENPAAFPLWLELRKRELHS